MIVLALDTSTDRAVIGLRTRSGAILSAATDSARRHGRDLVPQISQTLKMADMTLREVNLIAVGVGPGSYTGLRVGVMAAKMLAYATGAAILGVDSLEAIAQNAPVSVTQISVIGDAQRGQLYVADFLREDGGPPRSIHAVRIEPLTDWLQRLATTTLVMGPGLLSPSVKTALGERTGHFDREVAHPTGDSLVSLAQRLWDGGKRDDPWVLEPHYLRRSSAEELWERRDPANRQTTEREIPFGPTRP
jgi:tRNA threonylcarbamoyladenosine biosynthesis protein TsaB